MSGKKNYYDINKRLSKFISATSDLENTSSTVSNNDECILKFVPIELKVKNGNGDPFSDKSDISVRVPINVNEVIVPIQNEMIEVNECCELIDCDNNCVSNSNVNNIDHHLVTSFIENKGSQLGNDDLQERIRKRYVQNNITLSSLRSLLQLLKIYHPQLPCDPRTLL